MGKLLEGKTPQQAARTRVLDPACGCGSFLLGAYQFLSDWHRDWYVAHGAEKHARDRSPKLYRDRAGQWRLTTAEKKRILLDNIYGVDIDPQAVEVTKLSLLLKVLEGESEESIANQLRWFHQRALPDLGNNIKCGNSLIGPDFYEGSQADLLDEEERWRVNAFDWRAEFPAVFMAGGFDAVIGNPPYVSIQTMNADRPDHVRYFNAHYSAAGVGNYDIYVVFVEQALRLIGKKGLVGFILPSKFFATDYGRPLRGLISAQSGADGDNRFSPRAGFSRSNHLYLFIISIRRSQLVCSIRDRIAAGNDHRSRPYRLFGRLGRLVRRPVGLLHASAS